MSEHSVEGTLNCLVGAACYRRGGRQRERLHVVLEPAHANQVVFSLPHTLLVADLLRGPGAPRWTDAAPESGWTPHVVSSDDVRSFAACQWGRSVPDLLNDVGLSASPMVLRALPFEPRTVIGGPAAEVGNRSANARTRDHATAVCADAGLCISVLSRVTGDIYMRAREPVLDWDHLFNALFWADVPGVPSATLACAGQGSDDRGTYSTWHCWREPVEDTA